MRNGTIIQARKVATAMTTIGQTPIPAHIKTLADANRAKTCGYIVFGSLAQARKVYKRAHKVQHFLLPDAVIDRLNLKCAHCGGRMTTEKWNGLQPDHGGNEHGYLGFYSPRLKKFAHSHYTCAWAHLLDNVFGEFYDRVMGR